MKILVACILTLLSSVALAGSGTHVCYFADLKINLPSVFDGDTSAQAVVEWNQPVRYGSTTIVAIDTGGSTTVAYVTHVYGQIKVVATDKYGAQHVGYVTVLYTPGECYSANQAPPYTIDVQ